MKTTAPHYLTAHRPTAALLVAWFAAPLAWALHLGIGYALAGWACTHDARWTLHVLTLACLALAAVGIAVAWRVGRHGRAVPEASPDTPTRFVGRSGAWLGGLFFAVILVESVPIMLVESCR